MAIIDGDTGYWGDGRSAREAEVVVEKEPYDIGMFHIRTRISDDMKILILKYDNDNILELFTLGDKIEHKKTTLNFSETISHYKETLSMKTIEKAKEVISELLVNEDEIVISQLSMLLDNAKETLVTCSIKDKILTIKYEYKRIVTINLKTIQDMEYNEDRLTVNFLAGYHKEYFFDNPQDYYNCLIQANADSTFG